MDTESNVDPWIDVRICRSLSRILFVDTYTLARR